MSEFIAADQPHRRLNPLLNEWVLVSPHRAKRPWQGQVEAVNKELKKSYDAEYFLCAGNKRINGEVNKNYNKT